MSDRGGHGETDRVCNQEESSQMARWVEGSLILMDDNPQAMHGEKAQPYVVVFIESNRSREEEESP